MARVSVSVGTGRAFSDERSEENKYSYGKLTIIAGRYYKLRIFRID